MSVPGHSGRVLVNGDVLQDRTGSEFHNYPFEPYTVLPTPDDCDDEVPIGAPSSAPTGAPVFIAGDPHIKAWNGEQYDFHGVCDLVMLQNPTFNSGVGMDIHIRTKKTKQWSYIASAVLRIGEETLEVMGGNEGTQYWINGVAEADVLSVSGFTVILNQINTVKTEFIVYLNDDQKIIMKTFKEMVGVEMVATKGIDFGSSLGLMGTFREGLKMARDKVSILSEDNNKFGQEWQVQPSERMLFHNVEGPQAPEKCEIPKVTTLRRRLDESKISLEQAEIACSRVGREHFNICVFDVMATSDLEVTGVYN